MQFAVIPLEMVEEIQTARANWIGHKQACILAGITHNALWEAVRRGDIRQWPGPRYGFYWAPDCIAYRKKIEARPKRIGRPPKKKPPMDSGA